MTQLRAIPGQVPATPLFVRLVRDDAGARSRVLAALLLTGALAYLSVAIQRGASGPDIPRTVKMRSARAVKGYADARTAFWSDISARAATAYQKARL